MSTPPAVRKTVLLVHLTCSVGWVGAAASYLSLGTVAATSDDEATIRAMWAALEVVGWAVIVPFALGSLVTGIAVSLTTRWGLVRHWWVVLTLLLTGFAVAITVMHMPTVSENAEFASRAVPADLAALGGDMFHPAAGLVVLMLVMVLNVYKPRGRTRPAVVADDGSAAVDTL